VGLERGPLSLVSTTEELLERKCRSKVKTTLETATDVRIILKLILQNSVRRCKVESCQ
jgi:hypothetical protein